MCQYRALPYPFLFKLYKWVTSKKYAPFFYIQNASSITETKKNTFYQEELKMFTYSGAKLLHKHDKVSRFSLDLTVFP